MKKKFLALAIAFTTLFAVTTAVAAEDVPTVKADQDGELVISDMSLDAFVGMAPGESRTQTVYIKNESEDTMTFYIAQETIQSLEETNNASGGAYFFDLKVGNTQAEAESLLTKVAGGYDSDGSASSEGLNDIDEIADDSVVLATLASGESTYLFITLELYGEGNDNAEAAGTYSTASTAASGGYENAVGQLEFTFGLDKATHTGDPTVVLIPHDIVTNNPVYRYVSTGDHWTYPIYFTVFAVGLAAVLIGIKKKKAKED